MSLCEVEPLVILFQTLRDSDFSYVMPYRMLKGGSAWILRNHLSFLYTFVPMVESSFLGPPQVRA